MHMRVEALQSSLLKAAAELSRHGLEADITGSETVFKHASRAWVQDPYNEEHEYNLRCARLIHGALLVRDGKPQEASGFYAPLPPIMGGLPPTPESCRVFEAMEAVGRLYTLRVLSKRGDAATAADLLAAIPDERLNPWRGFVEILLIELYEATRGHRDADRALRLLNPERQPDLYAIALHKAGQGTGRIRYGLFGSRPATFRPEECLYYFNEAQS